MLIRKVGKVLLGKATSTQLFLACVLGSVLGFVPGIVMRGFGGGVAHAPALVLVLLGLVLVLNANLAAFVVTLVASKVLAVLLLPLSFEVGRFLLDGPTQPLFAALINAPFFAWMGLEHYATTGGVFLGVLFGIGFGWLLVTGVRRFRTKMAELEEGSEAYQKWSGKLWVRLLAWILLGGRKGKRTWREILERRTKGPPIRIAGVAVAAAGAVGLWLAQSFLSGPALRRIAQSNLETWNGATVDLAQAAVDLGAGRITIGGLAMADPNALERDSFRARTMNIAIGTKDLLSKRFVIDEITSESAAAGAKRDRPGTRIAEPPKDEGDVEKDAGDRTLEDYVAEAEKWKARLRRISDVLSKLAGPKPRDTETAGERSRRIAEAARVAGLVHAKASHLIRGAPWVLVRSLSFEDVEAITLGGEMLDVKAKNLSTQPYLVDEPLSISITSKSGRFGFDFSLGAKNGRKAQAKFVWKGLAADRIAGELKQSPIKGGTIDLELDGELDFSQPVGTRLDLPLRVTLHDTTLGLSGVKETKVDNLTLPIGLRGRLSSPRITLDDSALADALVAAGKSELAKQVRQRLGAALGDKAGDAVKNIGDAIEGKKKPADAVDAAKKAAGDLLKKKLPGGLFGGDKKK